MTVGTSAVRLDRFLAMRLPGRSRAFCKELVKSGKVTVDGERRPPDFRLEIGQLVCVRLGDPVWKDPPFEKWVIHEDADLLVLYKPAGVLVHPIGESWIRHPESVLEAPEATVAGLLWKFRPALRRSQVERCGIVHRLDRQTSGVLVTAKRAAAQRVLLRAFREREVVKIYRAIVLGRPGKTKVEAPIGRLPGRRRVQVTPWGKSARTDFRTLSAARGMSVVEAQPRTGRTHQIRAHLALLGHPVVGDHEWFKNEAKAHLEKIKLEPPPRMMLHAYRLRLVHPGTGKKASFTAAMPQDFPDYSKKIKA